MNKRLLMVAACMVCASATFAQYYEVSSYWNNTPQVINVTINASSYSYNWTAEGATSNSPSCGSGSRVVLASVTSSYDANHGNNANVSINLSDSGFCYWTAVTASDSNAGGISLPSGTSDSVTFFAMSNHKGWSRAYGTVNY